MLTNTEAAALMKAFYTPLQIETMFAKDHPTYAMVAKATDRAGKSWEVPVIHEEIAGASATFATAQTNAASTAIQSAVFSVTPVREYVVGTVDGLTVKATRNDKGAYVRALQRTIDSCFKTLMRVMAQNLFLAQWGDLSTILTGSISGATFKTKNPEDAIGIVIGDDLVLSATQNASLLRNAGAAGRVLKVDYNSGLITFTAAVLTIWPDAVVGDFIFREGDRQNSATPTALMMASFFDYVPDVAPTSTAFFGVDRSVSSRLGGARYDGTAESRREALQRGANVVSRLGGRPDYGCLNPTDYMELAIELGPAVRYVDVKAGTKAQLSFEAISVATPAGLIKMVSDPDQKKARALLLQMDTWRLGSLGEAPGFINFEDGNEFLRVSNADALEIRTGYYANLEGTAPGWNCNVQLPTT